MALVSPRFADNIRLQAAARNSPPLRKGETGEAVAILQRALVDLGFAMPLSTNQQTTLPDGIYGSETALTVREFQTRQALQQDGVAGRETLTRLDQLFTAEAALEIAMLPIKASRSFWT